MLMIRKMGPISSILRMLPGAGQMKDVPAQVDDKQPTGCRPSSAA